jgi:hypothetical protein
MKNITGTILGAAFTLCALVSNAQASAQQENAFPEAMSGKWLTSISNPETGETMKGSCTIASVDGVTTATFEMSEMGTAATTAFRASDADSFMAELDINGFVLGVYFDIIEGGLKCELDASGYLVPVALEREG